MKRVGPILLLLCLICACRGGSPRIEVWDTPRPPQNVIAYADFWEAMENLDFTYLTRYPVEAEQRQFGEALRHVVNADPDAAASAFQTLFKTAEDTLVRAHAADILANLLFASAQWEALTTLFEESPDLLGETERLLVDVFRRAPPEQVAIPPDPMRVSTSLSWTGVPKIEVEINGCRKTFWIDTGASISAISSDVAVDCLVHALTPQTLDSNTSTSKTVAVQPALIETMRIGEITIENHPVAIVDKADLTWGPIKVDGIIGWPVFRNVAMEINYAEGWTVLRKAKRSASEPRNFFWLGYPIVALQSTEGGPLYLGLDTGANKTGFKENILKKINARGLQIGGSTAVANRSDNHISSTRQHQSS